MSDEEPMSENDYWLILLPKYHKDGNLPYGDELRRQAINSFIKDRDTKMLDFVIGEDDPRNTKADGTICNTACHAISINLTKAEQRQRAKDWSDHE